MRRIDGRAARLLLLAAVLVSVAGAPAFASSLRGSEPSFSRPASAEVLESVPAVIASGRLLQPAAASPAPAGPGLAANASKADDDALGEPAPGILFASKRRSKSPPNKTFTVGSFDIQLQFLNPSTPPEAIIVFQRARARWMSVVKGTKGAATTASIPAGTENCRGDAGTLTPVPLTWNDLMVYVDISYIDGPGGVLGSSGICRYDDTAYAMPRSGSIQLDSADVTRMLADGSFYYVALHEMGHLLGIGTSWTKFHLMQLQRGNAPPLYVGAGGILGLAGIGGKGDPLIENLGGPGTARSHWKESVYTDELMTGWLSNTFQPLSLLSVQSLTDLGYVVDKTQADAFSIRPVRNDQSPAPKPPRAAHKRRFHDGWLPRKGLVGLVETRPRRRA